MADKIQVHKKIFWKMHDMTKGKVEACKLNEEVNSPSTKIVIGDNTTQWSLSFYPGANREEYKDSIALFLVLEDANSRNFNTSYKLGIIGKTGNREKEFEWPGESFNDGYGSKGLLKRADFLNPDLGYSVDGKATLYCELTITASAKEAPVSNIADSQTQNHLDKFKRMFDEELFTDFEIETTEKNNEKKFLKTHKNVLAFGSPYFYGMLTSDMKETKSNVVKVPEDSVIMREVLRFIYTGDEVENLSAIANELVFAAEKYQLDGLKEVCLAHIAKSLTLENVLQALLAADSLTDSKKLKADCIQMIVSNFKSLCNTEEWKKLTPGLLTEIMHKMNDENRDAIYL